VQHSVRASQLEARFRDVRLVSLNAGVAGVTTLLDPFALGAPGVRAELTPGGEGETTPRLKEDASKTVTGQGEDVSPALPPHAQPAPGDGVLPVARQAAAGFGSQLQMAAAQLRPLKDHNGARRGL
jgi:hypothetical protein